jgi:chitodextrinase
VKPTGNTRRWGWPLRPLILCGLAACLPLVVAVPVNLAFAASPTVLATSSSAMAYQHPAQDKVAYLHDGSMLVGYFDGTRAIVDQVKNPSTSPSVQQVQSISGDEITLYTKPGTSSTDIWIQVGAELTGAPLEQIQHGTYDGTNFSWDALTTIPGTTASGRQDPSVTWTGTWVIATWWDDTQGSNSDNVYLNWTADKTAQTGWQPSAILMTATGQNIVQVSVRHSAKLAATVLVYGARCDLWTRTLLDSKSNPGLAQWTGESMIDGAIDCGAGFGGPQIAIDESTGRIHVFLAVTNSNGGSWFGITYWQGTPDATPMSTGSITWSSRLIIDSSGGPTDPPDVAGAVDSSGTVYVVWVTSVSSGAMKYATLTSPYTSASAVTTFQVSGSQPRYPHIPAQAPLGGGYVPVVYQSGTGPYSLVLDTATIGGSPPPPSPSPSPTPSPNPSPTPDTTPPSVPAGLHASTTKTPSVVLSWSASTDNVGVAGYDVYRDGSGTPLATVSGSTLTYEDTTIQAQTDYSYRVDAFDAAGNHSAQSSAVVANAGDITPPSVPAGLSASATTTPSVKLQWSAATDNVGVTGYTIYRGGTVLTTVPATPTSYEDLGVVGSTTYSYTVDAFDAAGNHSAQSAPASATPPPQGWTSLGGTLASAPAVASSGPSRIDVFMRGSDNALYQRTWNGTSWSAWTSLGGVLTSSPSAISWGPNRIDVFVRGADNGLWHRSWNGTAWSGWDSLGGVLSSGAGSASRGVGRLDVFVRGGDNGLWHRSWNGTAWSGWESLGGSLTSDPSAVSWGSNRIDVFVRGSDNGLWHRSWNGSSWGAWQSLGGVLSTGVLSTGIGAASCTSGHLDVYVLGSDNAVWHMGYNGGWGGWQRLGGSWTSGPSATCPAGTHVVNVFERGTDLGLSQSNVAGT